MGPVIGRSAELDAIERFLATLADGPTALVFEGEPGIGKTTLLREGVDAARRGGARVLACAPTAPETRLSFAALGDLLADVDDTELEPLPGPQRAALGAALLRTDPGAAEVDRRAVGTGVLSLLEGLAAAHPVVVAIDDLQWLDQPTARALEFAMRRLAGSVGLIASRRVGEGAGAVLELRDPDRIEIRELGPFGVADLGRVVHERTAKRLPHPALARVHETSGGNPFYALELARALPADGAQPGGLPLPASLDEVVAARLAGLGADGEAALLAIAALADPTIELVERALGPHGVESVEEAEDRGVVEFDGIRWRFAHPLLAHCVYARASTGRRRALHRHLSEVVTDVEERARHLARAGAGQEAIEALDDAARQVRARGAPDAAAELLELAIELGGGPALRVRAAEHLSDAGTRAARRRSWPMCRKSSRTARRARRRSCCSASCAITTTATQRPQELLEWAREEPGADDRVRVMIDLRLGFMLFNVGRFAEASAATASALEGAERLGDPALLGQALASVLITDFALGRGLDERRLSQALALHDPDVRAPGELRPAHIASFLCRWTGQLPRARMLLDRLAGEQAERGEEHDLAWLGMWRVWTECAAGDLGRAATLADDAVDRLLALGTPHGEVLALAIRTVVAAYLGQTDDARRTAEAALELYEKSPWELSAIWVRSVVGFLDLSVGDHDAATAALTPLAAMATAGFAEPTAGDMFFHGDVAEAFVGVGRVDDAEPIVAWLEERGATLDRAWAIAVGARCRGLILAAAGDVEDAERSLERALAAHERLPMPIERGRTLLILGRIRRRLRKRLAAKEALDQALAIFESTRSACWADRVRDEIERLGLRPAADDDLTPSEERVATLAASGLTNREVAAALSVSPKTVEAHLARAYRKLGVSSRAELGARMAAPPPPPPQRQTV